MMETEYFSEDYRTARDRFRRMVGGAGGGLEFLALTAKGPGGEDLTIDIGWFGAASPRRALLHASGIHGVEGFAGSAIQLRLIESLPAIPEDAAIVFVHVLNPYGMAWLRRVNENNVDLNRNFLAQGEIYRGRPGGYDPLYGFLNPARLSGLDLFALRAAWLLLRHGRPALEAAVVTGQYDYPEGLFYGGRQLQPGPRAYVDFLTRRLGAAETVFGIDVHTGLGRFGKDTLLVAPARYDRLRRLLGQRVESFSEPGSRVAYRVRGGHHDGVQRALGGADVDFLGQEFGTYSQIRVLAALRRENYFHQRRQTDLGSPHKRGLKEAFCPGDRGWRKQVVRRGKALFDRAWTIVASP